MLIFAHGLLQVERPMASAQANMLLATRRVSDSMADLYVALRLREIWAA